MRYDTVVGVETKIAAELAIAKTAIRKTRADPRIGWAWLEAEYRSSPARAFHGRTDALTIEDRGMPSLEAAMEALLSDQRVRTKWRDDDLWTTVLSLLAAVSADSSLDLEAAVRKLVKPAPVRSAAALANVTWAAEPASLGVLTIAQLRSEPDAEALAGRLGLERGSRDAFVAHSRRLLSEVGECVLATATSDRQGELAYEDFERGLEDFFGLILMLSDRLEECGIFSLRGATNRPGVRGITLDRGALGHLLAGKGSAELAARVLTITGWSAGDSSRWMSADPMPLDRLLDANLHPLLDALLTANDAIAQRLRVAARWYARAFWADAQDDAALAVSVALDSLLAGKDAVPGAVSKGRFALLERDPDARAARFDRYEQVYRVRSAIAHGGDATRPLARIGGARSILDDARWTAKQLLALRKISTPNDDDAFRDLWSAVQWGTLRWAERTDD
jgi:hypothetical protein